MLLSLQSNEQIWKMYNHQDDKVSDLLHALSVQNTNQTKICILRPLNCFCCFVQEVDPQYHDLALYQFYLHNPDCSMRNLIEIAKTILNLATRLELA